MLACLQGIGLSVIVTQPRNESVYLWQGERWLSGPGNPAACPSLCDAPTGACAQTPGYVKGYDFNYWIPLSFDAQGRVEPFASFVDSFELDI